MEIIRLCGASCLLAPPSAEDARVNNSRHTSVISTLKTAIEENYEHSSPIPDQRSTERSRRSQRLSQLCDAKQCAIDAHNSRRAAYVRHRGRFRPRSDGADIRRGRKADASHDDAG